MKSFDELSPFVRFAMGAGGLDNVKAYKDMYANQQLASLGQDLANGKIDQAQYLRSIAQYSPEQYQKMALANISNQPPAVLQEDTKIQEFLDQGDKLLSGGDREGAQRLYDRANRLMSLARSSAYGVNTFQLPQGGEQAPGNVSTSPLANLMQGPAIPSPQDQPTQADKYKMYTEPVPTDATNPIARQIAANAGLKKSAELDAEAEKAAKIEEQKRKGKGEISEEDKKKTGQNQIASTVDNLISYYNKLAEMKGIGSTSNMPIENISASIRSSTPGQFMGRVVGTEEQKIRDDINTSIPTLISAIRSATGMSAKAMDSNAELQFYLQQASDPSKLLETNIGALNRIKELYGLNSGDKNANAPSVAPKAQSSSDVVATKVLGKDTYIKKSDGKWYRK